MTAEDVLGAAVALGVVLLLVGRSPQWTGRLRLGTVGYAVSVLLLWLAAPLLRTQLHLPNPVGPVVALTVAVGLTVAWLTDSRPVRPRG